MSRRASLHHLFSIASLACLAMACSRQAEGERCSLTNGNSDCEEGLICTEAENLRGNEDGVDRCCPEVGEDPSDPRCEIRTTAAPGDGDGGDGDSGGGGAGGFSGDGDLPVSLGDACQYNSDCVLPLVCGPGGQCQWECNTDRDCDDGEACSGDDERRCVPE